MRVATLASEVVPFAKTGGLADVAGALPKALRKHGVDAVIVLPLYQQVDRCLLSDKVIDLPVEWRGDKRLTKVFLSAAADATAYLIDAPEYFSRPSIYDQFFRDTKTVFSIHNMAYQGRFDPGDLWWLGFGDRHDKDDFVLNGTASALKAGLMAADALSTVSRRYAFEIQTPAQGYGLDWLLRMRRNRLLGITNGVDYDIWNPETDPHIAAHFSENDLSGKRKCKADLLRRFTLAEELDRPIIAIISRLVAQKGYDLIQPLARAILEAGCFFIALGSGAKEYEDFLQAWHDIAPDRVGIFKGYAGEPLAHQIEAGADIFLMPSQYEPCGLNQMYSMRYGTVPIVRATGGLDDTVENFDEARGTGNGFKFQDYTPAALLVKIREALYFYGKPEAWTKIQRNGMNMDNSWPTAAKKYVDLYSRVLEL